jgi:hypothetical protein
VWWAKEINKNILEGGILKERFVMEIENKLGM